MNIHSVRLVLSVIRQFVRKLSYKKNKVMTEKELEDILEQLSESEDDFDETDESDEELEVEDSVDLCDTIEVSEEPFDWESMDIELEDGTVLQPPATIDESNEKVNDGEINAQNLPNNHVKKLKEKYSKITWKKEKFSFA
ncbi:uncharacterized protein [Diabrotica undecimpunctata]|uniref:uncharacterized protein n=1 Tax=Diabrotica undecimpunctata TaxID=50387 RepID=UPI003B63B914